MDRPGLDCTCRQERYQVLGFLADRSVVMRPAHSQVSLYSGSHQQEDTGAHRDPGQGGFVDILELFVKLEK